MNNRIVLILITSIASILWGTTYLVATEYLPPSKPFTAGFFRIFPAGILLLLWCREFPKKKDWGKILMLSILNFSVFQVLLFISTDRLSGGLASILNSTRLLMVFLFVWWLEKKKISQKQWLYAVLGVIGIVILMFSPSQKLDIWGVIAAFLGALSLALGTFLTKYWQVDLSILSFTGWQLFLGGLCLLPIVFYWEEPFQDITYVHIGAYAYLCVFCTLIAYVLWFRGIKKLSPAIVSPLGLLTPAFAVFLGWLVAGESIGIKSLLGFIMVFISIFGVQKGLDKK